MSYNISSSKLQHPLLKPILEKLTEYFAEMNIQFYVIGATARDIIMSIHDEKSVRATHDLDIAIAISDWNEFEKVEEGIVKIDGFTKDVDQRQRFRYLDKFLLDIVPFGDIMKEEDKIFWPPDESIAMTVLGFSEVQNFTKKVKVDENLYIEVASLDGIFILKLMAWFDRHTLYNKDADDMAFILNNYLNINENRAINDYYDDIYLTENFSTNTAGAKLLGMDMAKILANGALTKARIIEIIETEIEKKERSRLINQIIETNRSFHYEETLMCLKNIVKGLHEN